VALLGDAIYTNPLVLGYAWQKGWMPLSLEALVRAIELNGVRSRRTRPHSTGAAAGARP
jgi:Pyruvate/2-oxoacid:ferredoxin oxidoreductase gamma subunit